MLKHLQPTIIESSDFKKSQAENKSADSNMLIVEDKISFNEAVETSIHLSHAFRLRREFALRLNPSVPATALREEIEWEIKRFQKQTVNDSQKIAEWISYLVAMCRFEMTPIENDNFVAPFNGGIEAERFPLLALMDVHKITELMDNVICLTEDFSSPQILQCLGNALNNATVHRRHVY